MRKRKNLFIKNNKGMTLLEIMISVVMLSFISLGIMTITQNSVEIKETTVQEDRETLQVEKAFYRFAFDFEQIYSPLFFTKKMNTPINTRADTTPQDQQIIQSKSSLISHYNMKDNFNGITQQGEIIPVLYTDGKSTFAFYTMSNRRKYQNSKESIYTWVLYTLENKTITDEFGDTVSVPCFTRYFSPHDPFGEPIWQKKDQLKSQILLPNVEKLIFKFWHPEKKKFIEDLSLIKGGKNLVRGVQIELTWKDQKEIEHTTTRFFKPAWDYFKPESEKEIQSLQNKLRQYGKKEKASGA